VRSESKTVLIVDDDTALRDSLADILRDEGYNPITTGTCAEALQIVSQKKPGAALLDLKLPDGAGTTLLANLKKLDPDCICTIVTAYADLDSAVAALETGAFQYLQKPVRPMELLNLLERIFDIIDLRAAKYQAEERLRESENRFRAIFETAQDAIYMKDRNRKYVLVNPKAENFLGFPASELIGNTAEEFFSEDGAAVVRESDNRVLSGETVEEERTMLVKGVPLTFHVVRVPMHNTSGQVSGICVIARDITEKLKMEAQLAQAQKMEAIGTIAGGIAHDFNNILGAIVGYTELAQLDLTKGSTAKAHLDAMLIAAKRATDLVKQILAFSHQDGQKAQPIDLIPIVKTSLELMRASLPTTININSKIASDTGVVSANSTQIQQVLMNLITNAAHAMSEEGGDLTVSLENIDLDREQPAESGHLIPGRYARLTVMDTGHGMDEKTKQRIFDPYFTTKEKGVGTGLGLAVVQGIVTKAGGSIAVESELGEGTTFSVFLPRIGNEAEKIERNGTRKPLPQGRECILFVDDEWSLVNVGQQLLKKLGYKVIAKTNSVEALEAFRAQPDEIDLVITDQTMPDMTGDILARQILQLKPGVPVIICSGFSEKMNKEKARAIGIRQFVLKPIAMMELAQTIRRILDES
jgi:PAS domain S-box-containing protein